LIAMLAGVVGVVAALLAAIGLYGLLRYSVTRRTREIGIRIALGATRGDVVRIVTGSALVLVFTGLVAGIPLSMWSSGYASSVLAIIAASEARGPITLGAGGGGT